MKKFIIFQLLFISLAAFPSLEAAEYRLGLSMHDVERRIEGGPALSFEKIFDRPSWWHPYAGRPHLGTHISLANNTHLLYAGSSWDLFKRGKFSGELAFGAALHSGEEDIKNDQLSAQHMSNGSLCDPNQGLTSVGFRLAWKIN